MSGWYEEEGEDHGGVERGGRGWVSGTLARKQGSGIGWRALGCEGVNL